MLSGITDFYSCKPVTEQYYHRVIKGKSCENHELLRGKSTFFILFKIKNYSTFKQFGFKGNLHSS